MGGGVWFTLSNMEGGGMVHTLKHGGGGESVNQTPPLFGIYITVLERKTNDNVAHCRPYSQLSASASISLKETVRQDPLHYILKRQSYKIFSTHF